ncbi:MAG: hypothetical protein IJ933_06500, partial [Bacteroidales bacterium]|nr:hypothetical protein [Bacteroidales bacterium]
MMTISELYINIKKSLTAQFPDPKERGIVSRRIVGGVTGLDGNECILHPDRRVEIDNTAVNNIIKRISDHEPLEYVFNSAQFIDIELYTNSNVLIPRPETEELALKIVGDIQARLQCDNRVGDKPISILDIGTGRGCIP